MGALRIGGAVSVPELPGRWSVWSQAADSPGAHFIVPLDDQARGLGVKYAVVRAKQAAGEATPQLSLVRTDPVVEGLIKPVAKKRGKK